jgi:phage portal protein BeeE
MFGWLFRGGNLRAENDRLRGEVQSLKATATAPPPAEMVAGAGPTNPLSTQPNLAATREQLRHFKDWQYIAIEAIAKRCAKQELRVGFTPAPRAAGLVTKSASLQPEPLESHPLIDAINDPNPWMVKWNLIYLLFVHLGLAGKAYWWFREVDDRLQIYPFPPDWVSPIHSGGQLFASWLIRPPGNPEGFTIDGDEIAYFFKPSPTDPYDAISPLQSQAAAVNLNEAIQIAQVATMHNSVKPGVILTAGRLELPAGVAGQGPRPVLTPEQRKQLLEAIRQAYAGMQKYGNTAIVDGLIEAITPFSTAADDVGYDSGIALAKGKILQAFGIHDFIVGAAAPSSYAQASVVSQLFCDNVCNPLLDLAGQVLTEWLSMWFTGPTGEKLKVWFEPCHAEDADLQFRKMSLLSARKAITVNELRAYGGFPPVPGGDELPDSDGPAIDLDALKSIISASDPYSPPAHKSNGQANRIVGQVAR